MSDNIGGLLFIFLAGIGLLYVNHTQTDVPEQLVDSFVIAWAGITLIYTLGLFAV